MQPFIICNGSGPCHPWSRIDAVQLDSCRGLGRALVQLSAERLCVLWEKTAFAKMFEQEKPVHRRQDGVHGKREQDMP